MRETNTTRSSQREILAFNQFIQELELVEIPMIGRSFTWYSSQGNVTSRLDRMLVSLDWSDL